MIRIRQINVAIDEDENELITKCAKKLKTNKENIEEYKIVKKSIDARDKQNIVFCYEVDIKAKNEDEILRKNKSKDIFEASNTQYEFKITGKQKMKNRPVIVGSGPAGLFCGYMLASYGYKPIIIERGEQIEKRVKTVETFWKEGNLNKESNVQFGEGGAGTFSDGKLNTLVKDKMGRNKKVLEMFVEAGAPNEILYLNKPHIGTDLLRNVIINLRNKIINMGGDIRYNSCLTNIEIQDSHIKSIEINNNEKIETEVLILAIGHSARDTFKKLNELGVKVAPKNFAVGVRIEHLQKDINIAQYGNKTKLRLGSADYKLVYHASNGRTCYTFCMCPGGKVMASNSEESSIVTNGMSNFARDGENANSALLVNISIEDFYKESPLDGMYFQEELEKKAFELGGKNYNAPIQRVEDFLENKTTTNLGKIKPTYMPGVTFANLNEILPEFVSNTLKEGLTELDQKLHGFAEHDAIMTGVETRSSSPVQITRDKETMNSINVQGLYPCGEGAGYAGGIMTAAIDGIKCAIKIIEKE